MCFSPQLSTLGALEKSSCFYTRLLPLGGCLQDRGAYIFRFCAPCWVHSLDPEMVGGGWLSHSFIHFVTHSKQCRSLLLWDLRRRDKQGPECPWQHGFWDNVTILRSCSLLTFPSGNKNLVMLSAWVALSASTSLHEGLSTSSSKKENKNTPLIIKPIILQGLSE